MLATLLLSSHESQDIELDAGVLPIPAGVRALLVCPGFEIDEQRNDSTALLRYMHERVDIDFVPGVVLPHRTAQKPATLGRRGGLQGRLVGGRGVRPDVSFACRRREILKSVQIEVDRRLPNQRHLGQAAKIHFGLGNRFAGSVLETQLEGFFEPEKQIEREAAPAVAVEGPNERVWAVGDGERLSRAAFREDFDLDKAPGSAEFLTSKD